MSSIFTAEFWKQAAERAIKTAAQVVLLAWGGGDVVADLFAFDWRIGLGAAGGGFVLSILSSIISAPLSSDNTPSLV